MQDPTQPGVGAYLPFDGNAYNTTPTNYLITPSRRIQLFSTGDVNLGSEARAFFEASYVNRTSAQSLAPMPLVNSTIPTAPVTVSKDSIYNPFGVDITSWRKRMVEFGERNFRQDLDTFRIVAGLDGSLGDWAGPLSGWAWDLDYNHGRTAGNQLQTGQLRMPNVANATGPSMRDPATGQPICVRVPGDATSVVIVGRIRSVPFTRLSLPSLEQAYQTSPRPCQAPAAQGVSYRLIDIALLIVFAVGLCAATLQRARTNEAGTAAQVAERRVERELAGVGDSARGS